MGMDKCHVKDYDELVKEFEQAELDKFARKYIKYYALIGESRSIQFIENKITEYYGKIETGSTASIKNS